MKSLLIIAIVSLSFSLLANPESYHCGDIVKITVIEEGYLEAELVINGGGSLDLEESDEDNYDFRGVLNGDSVRVFFNLTNKVIEYSLADKESVLLICEKSKKEL